MDVKCNMVIIVNVSFPVPSFLMLRVEDREVKDFFMSLLNDLSLR